MTAPSMTEPRPCACNAGLSTPCGAVQNMRTAEALACLRWGFEAMRSKPLTATHGTRSVALSGDGVLTVTDTKTGEILAVSVPGMKAELDPAFVPPASFAEELD
jgi:hypothetical protein